jgi:hypothetical protein
MRAGAAMDERTIHPGSCRPGSVGGLYDVGALAALLLCGCSEGESVDWCRGIDCSGHGTCVVAGEGAGHPECRCDPGYRNAGLTACVPDVGADGDADAGAEAEAGVEADTAAEADADASLDESGSEDAPLDERGGADAEADGDADADVDAWWTVDSACWDPGPVPPPVYAADITIAAPFDAAYQAYDVGAVPGLPHTRYGGCTFDLADPNRLLIAVDAEASSGAIYAVCVMRDPEGHVVGFHGTADRIADTPYVDANLIWGDGGVLLYSEWPVYLLGQLLPGESAPAREIDLGLLGVDDSPGGLAFVPEPFPSAGELRAVGWPAGKWYHFDWSFDGTLYDITSVYQTATLPNGPGGIAYVPPGSPFFDVYSVVIGEWPGTTIAVYEVDVRADPVVGTRRLFLSGLGEAWAAYFEPVTGDFMFPTWGTDRVLLVRGFVPFL